MAGIYSPSVTSFPNGVVTVASTDSTSYSQITNSMGSYVYGISKIYVRANNASQLLKPMTFTQYDVNGVIEQYSQIITVDPYQYQSSTFFDLTQKNVVLNGRNNLTFSVLPSENVSVVFYTEQISNRDYANPTNFFKDEFFTDFSEEI
jgi:hypothetical protein